MWKAIVQALSLGFTSVMFDGSHLSLEENITYTKQVRLLANAYGAAVEGEIGRVGGTEDGKGTACLYSRAKDAAQFCAETGVDALAVAIGNAHGVYKGEPALRFDLLGEILHAVETPLVLHGGTGISKDGFCACVRGGIRKINIATANFNAVDTALKLHYGKETSGGYFAASSCMVNAVRDKVRELILIFGSDGRVS